MIRVRDIEPEEMILKEIENKKEELENLRKEIKNLEKYKQYEAQGEELKAMYDGLVNAGFDEEKAFKIFIILLNRM